MALQMRRRDLLRAGYGAALTATLAACAPQVVKETVVVEKEKVVEKEVTTVVEKEIAKEVTRLVEGPTAIPKPKEKVTLTFAMRSGSNQLYDDRLAEFVEETDGMITAEYVPIATQEYMVKLQTMAAAKTLPDILWTCLTWCDHQWLVRKGMLSPINDWLAANNQDTAQWVPAAVESLTIDGELHGIPVCCHPGHSFLFINEDMFEAAGIPTPEVYNENTPADLLEWAKELSSGPADNRDVFGYLPPMRDHESWLAPIRCFGASNWDAEGKVALHDSEEWWGWASWMDALYEGGYAAQGAGLPAAGEAALFGAGKVAMVCGPRGFWINIKTAVNEAGGTIKWSAVRMPRQANYIQWPAGIDTIAPSVNSQHLEEACELCYAFGDRRASMYWYLKSARVSARVDDLTQFVELTDNEFVKLGYQLQLDEAPIELPGNLRMREIESYLLNQWTAFWPGGEDVTPDAMKRIKSDIDRVLERPIA